MRRFVKGPTGAGHQTMSEKTIPFGRFYRGAFAEGISKHTDPANAPQ